MTSCIRARCPLLRRELPPSRWTEIPQFAQLRADSFVRSTVFTDRGGETTGESVHCFAQVAQVPAHELAFVPADVVRIERIVAECLEKLRNRIERGILPLRGLRRRFAGRRSRWLSSKISSLCRKRFNELIS